MFELNPTWPNYTFGQLLMKMMVINDAIWFRRGKSDNINIPELK